MRKNKKDNIFEYTKLMEGKNDVCCNNFLNFVFLKVNRIKFCSNW